MNRVDWLKSLACYPQVQQRLTAAARLSSICDYVVAQVGEDAMPCSKGALYDVLNNHRAELLTKTGVVVGRSVARELAASATQVSEFTELNWLVEHQHRRVDRMLSAERRMGVVSARVSDEMRLHSDLVSQLADLKIKVGLASAIVSDMARSGATHERLPAETGDPETDGRIADVTKRLESPQSRRRVTDFLTRIMTKDGQADLTALGALARPVEVVDE